MSAAHPLAALRTAARPGAGGRPHPRQRRALRAAAATLAIALAAALATTPLHAADLPDAGSQQALERQQREREAQRQRLERPQPRPDVAAPPAEAAPAGASTVRNIPVTRIETGPSALLPPEALRAALAPFEGRTLSLADLQAAAEAVNQLYAAQGAPTARALLPPQDVTDGVVRLTLVEARLGALRLQARRLSPGYVLPRLGLQPGELVSVPRIEAALQRFNRSQDARLSATLAAGSRPGTTDLDLLADEPPALQASAFADNAGAYALGEERLGLSLRWPLLSDRADSLTIGLLATGRAPSLSGNLGYSLPLADDRRLELSFSDGRIAVRRGSAAALDVTGHSRELALALTQALRLAPEGSWTAGLRLAGKQSATLIGGNPVRDQRLTVLALTSALDWQDASGGWTADATLARGLPVAGGDLGFTALRLNAARLQRLDDRHQLLLRGALQASPTAALPSSEQFLLGGVATVRGYSEGLLSGQRGALASAELRHTLALACGLPCSAQLSGFVDAGQVRAAGAPGPQQLTAAGLGLAADRGTAGLRASLAWPLRDATDEPARRRPRLHLAASLAW